MQNTYQKKILDLEAANNAPRIKLEGGKKFKIKSDFQPAGDQPEAIKLLTKNLRDKKNEQVLLGVTGSGKTFTMAKVIENTNRPALILAPRYDPIYTVMLSYEKDNDINIDGGLNLHKDVSFFMKQNFKFPDLKDECWVLNLNSKFTNKNLDIDNNILEKKVISIFESSFNINQKPKFQNTHRWLYAQTKITYNSLSKKNWIGSKDSKIFLSGDWVMGRSLSDAWNAGLQLSHYLKILNY